MGWLLGNLFLLSVILVVAGLWWLYGALMWWLGWRPDDHPAVNVIAAFASLWGGYIYATWGMRLIERMEYRRALR